MTTGHRAHSGPRRCWRAMSYPEQRMVSNQMNRVSAQHTLRRRALIVSTDRDRGTLAAARALHRTGWFVGVGVPGAAGMVGASSAVSARFDVPRPRGDCRPFVEGVQQALAAGDFDVLFGAGDDWMAAVSLFRDEFGVPVAHPDFDVVHEAMDKVHLASRGRQAGLATPRTEPATAASMAAWTGPVVVKCRAHWSVGQTRPHRIEAQRFPDAASARTQVDRIRSAGADPILQVPLPGRLSALIGLFDGVRLRGKVAQVSPRVWPTPNGVSTRARTVPVDEGLVGRAETLLRSLGWHGLVELQFLTGADGVPHLIDLNGRFFGSMALANAAVPRLADAWGRMAMGHPLPDLPAAAAGRRYAWTAGDLRRAGAERRGGLMADVLDSVRWGLGAEHSVWDRKDRGPTWHLATWRLWRRPRSRRGAPAGSVSRA